MTSTDLPVLELAFPGPLRDSGVAAILAGEKTALTGLLQIYEHGDEPVPRPGQRFSVIDSLGRSAAVIEITEVRVLPISMVDDGYAHAEGRGYADAADWRQAHEEFFTSEGVAEYLGVVPVMDDDTLVVTERFRLIGPGVGQVPGLHSDDGGQLCFRDLRYPDARRDDRRQPRRHRATLSRARRAGRCPDRSPLDI